MADIFLSYAEEDRGIAQALTGHLERLGWSVWWDRRIPAGKTWRGVIEEALHSTRCMIVLWSRHSVVSQWVQEEAEEGRALGMLVPVFIEQVRPPLGFRGIQAADMVDWDLSSDAAGFRQLIADLERRLEKGAQRPDGATPHRQAADAAQFSAAADSDATPARPVPPSAPDKRDRSEGQRDRRASPRALAVLAGLGALAVAVVLAILIRDGGVLPVPSSPAPAASPAEAGREPANSPTPGTGRRGGDEQPSGSAETSKASARCREIVLRGQLGEALSPEDREALRNECR